MLSRTIVEIQTTPSNPQSGCVANGRIANGLGASRLPSELHSDAECLMDEPARQRRPLLPPDLPFAYLVHRLVARDRSQRTIHTAKSQTRRDALFDESMILLQHVVQVRTGPATARPSEFTVYLQCCYGLRIGWVSVHVDHRRPDGP
jgi:hypothetical protein